MDVYLASKSISRRGPLNCRSLGFARDDNGRATPSFCFGFARWAFVKTHRPPNDTRAEDRFSVAPTALGIIFDLISQPFRAGLTFGGRPSGPCVHGDFCSVGIHRAVVTTTMQMRAQTFPLSSRAQPRDLQFHFPSIECLWENPLFIKRAACALYQGPTFSRAGKG
jgi:hypothetical protein